MGMLKHEMKKGMKCYVQVHEIPGDITSRMIESKAVILAPPIMSTVLVKLGPPYNRKMHVPVDCIYWTKQE